MPGRCAITVVSVRSPSIVWARTVRVLTEKPPRAAPASPRRARATWAASSWSPALPGAAVGEPRGEALEVGEGARAVERVGCEVRGERGRAALRENPAITSANSSGMKAAR